MKMRIFLEDIKIYAYHGAMKEEQQIGTDFLVSVEIETSLYNSVDTDNLQETLDYRLINDLVHREMAIKSQLLEHVVGRIMRGLHREFKGINYGRVRLTKLQPPVQGEMKGVSVELEENFKEEDDLKQHF